jgi:N6-adenosine-specific RNA methylase IME4/ParB-like chromosome segregation protein Spo0J
MAEVKYVACSAIQCTQRIRTDYGDIDALAQSIATIGLLHPIVVDTTFRLIAGERRLRAHQQLGKTDILATVTDEYAEIVKAIHAERDENTERKDWTPLERLAMAKRLEPYEKNEAAQRQATGKSADGTAGGRGRKKAPEKNLTGSSRKVSSRHKREAKSRTTKAVGVDRRTLEKIEVVDAAAKKDPERFGPVAQKMDQTGKVDGAYRKVKQAEKVDQLRARETAPEPFNGLYDVLVIDPPWPVAIQGREERPAQIGLDYVPMTLEQIRAIALPTAEACHVWLWTTQRFLPEAVACLAAWGLTYVCCFVWHKPGGMQPMYLPQFNCEFAVYGRKGAPVFAETSDFFTCFKAPRQDHSAKPEAFYEVLRRVTAGRRLDMFARRSIQGFDGWGNQAP